MQIYAEKNANNWTFSVVKEMTEKNKGKSTKVKVNSGFEGDTMVCVVKVLGQLDMMLGDRSAGVCRLRYFSLSLSLSSLDHTV